MKYDRYFFEGIAHGPLRSARETLQYVNAALHPRSVVDVGCGVGGWLKAWTELGVEDVWGIDGDYVPRDTLLIPADRFQPMDLTRPGPAPRRFDLVESLEVAEHLPASAAEGFVALLCSLAPVVLFSAAIPGQGGHHHINEQWPEYWAELFQKNGFVVVDTLRDCVWDNPHIDHWYRQNALLFVEAENRDAIDKLTRMSAGLAQKPLSRIHPYSWHRAKNGPQRLPWLIKIIPLSVVAFAQRKLDHVKSLARR
jgi:SAM-dependent methyltransferase